MVEVLWEKVRKEIFSTAGGCVSIDFDGKVTTKPCWLCEVTSKERCCLSAMDETSGNDIARDWLFTYAEERTRLRSARG